MKHEELIYKYFDGSISKQELDILNFELDKDKELLREFILEAHMENALESYLNKDHDETIQFPEEEYDGEISIDDLENIAAAGMPTPLENDN